jgi:hypothetical protein
VHFRTITMVIGDEDITMLDTSEICFSTSYKSSPTWFSRPVQTQPTTLN